MEYVLGKRRKRELVSVVVATGEEGCLEAAVGVDGLRATFVVEDLEMLGAAIDVAVKELLKRIEARENN